MKYNKLGNSGLFVSAMSYGTWGSQLWSNDEELSSCINLAYDLGITTFDTADIYGNSRSEEVLGNTLKNKSRSSYEIATKVFWSTSNLPNSKGLSRKHIIEAVNGSLKRLGTDYIDLYQTHGFDDKTPVEETLSAFDDLIRQGKVLYIGTSNWNAEQIQNAINIQKQMNYNLFVSNQPQYSALCRGIESSIIPTCEKNGISQVVWSPLAMGILSGKYNPDEEYPNNSRAKNEHGQHIMAFMNKRMLRAVQQLKPIADSLNISVSQMCLAWVLSNKNVATIITGAKNQEQLLENIKAVDIILNQDIINSINEALSEVQY